MLKKLTAAGVAAAAVTGALLLAAPANAGIGTSGEGGVLSGNQVIVPITAPINVCGNAVAVVGGAVAGCRGGASVSRGPGHRPPCHHYRPPCHRHDPWSSS